MAPKTMLREQSKLTKTYNHLCHLKTQVDKKYTLCSKGYILKEHIRMVAYRRGKEYELRKE